jgi:tetratricopeptide (TPR) repeat protein
VSEETQNQSSAGSQAEVPGESAEPGARDEFDRFLKLADQAKEKYEYAFDYMNFGSENERVAAAHALAAFAKLRAGDPTGVSEEFRKAVQIAPGFAAIFRLWAFVETALGRSDRADKKMQRAVVLAPRDASIWLHWAHIERRRGRLAEAMTCLLKAQELAPDDSPILAGLGMLEKARGRYERAAGLLRRALENVPAKCPLERHKLVCSTSLASTYLQWAGKLEETGQHDLALVRYGEAFNYARQAVALDETDMKAVDVMVEVAFSYYVALAPEQGFTKARLVLERAILLNPIGRRQRHYTGRACCIMVTELVKLGRREEAAPYFEVGSQAVRDLRGLAGREFSELLPPLCPKVRGTLTWVAPSGNIGELIVDGAPPNSVIVRRVELSPGVSQDEFRSLIGRSLTFRVGHGTGVAIAKDINLEPSGASSSADAALERTQRG